VSKKKDYPTMGDLWVMAATVLAFQKAHKLSTRVYLRQFDKDRRKLFRKIEAFRRDPANRDAIIAEHRAAAEQIGLRATKQ
jgi:hypothetical protein